MKRRMESPGKAAQPESKMKVRDPGMLAGKTGPKKLKPDVMPQRAVPAKGRPTKGGNSMSEKLKNKRI
jgi:hypothetical protein